VLSPWIEQLAADVHIATRFRPPIGDNLEQNGDPNGSRLSACGSMVLVRRTCLATRCKTAHNRSLRRQIFLSSTRRDHRLGRLASVEAHHCIGCSAWRAGAEPAGASDFLIVGHGARRMGTTLRKPPKTGSNSSLEKHKPDNGHCHHNKAQAPYQHVANGRTALGPPGPRWPSRQSGCHASQPLNPHRSKRAANQAVSTLVRAGCSGAIL
jgi:hypothetical protein